METETLLRAIDSAFGSVRRPEMTLDGLLHELESIDGLWVTALIDCDVATWQDVPADVMEAEMHALTALCPEAFRFFLPAYMSYVVRNYEHSNLTDYVIYALDPTKSSTIRTIKMGQYQILTEAQSAATLKFLQFFADPTSGADDVVAKQAIEDYWSQFDVA